MAISLPPIQIPPRPPEIPVDASPAGRVGTWVGQLGRVIQDAWRHLLSLVNSFEARLTALEAGDPSFVARVTALENRVKDVYTFSRTGTLAVGPIALPLRVVAASTLVELVATVETAPTGANLIIEIRKNGTPVGTVTIPAGQTFATTTLSVALLEDSDALRPEVTQVGATEKGKDLVVQARCR
jgi:hypothetical protein